ncbi:MULTISPECIES: type VI secretion system baseplate subunit TssE [Pseudomonas]|uniref:type VI secretion system baseplate subunit TssE n=1 Tax=Pseudomonas TaxID=286 RepID=UPI001BE83318|nr:MULTISPECIES: type VI secretion system baseplate subunit TssE [Pseudomonas]MBT2337567.1 type VI secretion system baseplate subunit TssE [Pseudomonas fluorescens]MCD4530806.1 type VI secretion system baseplate subunit TssE [Pseudomonas sp. C3-2018]
MSYGSLFERLAGEVETRRGWSTEMCATASVVAHLAKMLSVRAGSVSTLPDYGLPELNDMRLSLHDARSQARYAIEGFIEAYEPRLSNVCVTSMPSSADQLWLSFNIDGLLDVKGFKRQVSFIGCLDGSGQVKVRQG